MPAPTAVPAMIIAPPSMDGRFVIDVTSDIGCPY
ncbi:Uncharacterised protein [Proteus penneri]|nr:Uncharacterised protein [Proteus penneri]